MDRAQLTFIPGGPVPAGGSFALWLDVDDPTDEAIAAAAVRLGLPGGTPGSFTGLTIEDGVLVPVERPARLLTLLPAVRRLATLPPGSDWPRWTRPSDSVLAWSAASKLALELVAAGRLLPQVWPTDTPGEVVAGWRAVASDERVPALAAALPMAAVALADEQGLPRPAEGLVRSYLDAVADTCARSGRRPQLADRRRATRRPWVEMLPAALAGSDPTVGHLRTPAEEVAADLAEWGAPVLGGAAAGAARLVLRLEPPVIDGDEAAWWVGFGLRSTTDRSVRITAEEVWSAARARSDDAAAIPAPERALTRQLAAAARLFPPLDRALDEAWPTGVELAAVDAAALLGEAREALVAAGFAVELPAELAGVEDRRLRLRLRLGANTETLRRTPADDGLDAAALTDLHFEVALGEDAISPEEFSRIVALGQPLVRWRGRWVKVDPEEVERIAEQLGTSAAVSLTEALAAALSGAHHLDGLGSVETVADGALAHLVTQLRDHAPPGAARIEGIEGSLRPYQERGVAWLQRLTDLGLGGVLADQMGLGKTLQAISLLTSRPGDRPHLVVCPTSVVGNWERELARFAPGAQVLRHHGPQRAVSRRSFTPGTVVVTSYAVLRRDVGLLEEVAWDVAVLDEAQQIKNPASKGARAARALNARARIAMTGTPLENRLGELWSIIDVTNPGLLGSRRAFDERFGVPIERWHDDVAAKRLRRLIAPFVLRRRKDDPEVAVDLPPKQELTVTCGLTREQAALYQATVERAFSGAGLGATAFERRGRILALLTALKQICNHPRQYLRDDGRLEGRSGKLTRATEILGEVVDAGEAALVFTQFREMGELLAEHLAAELDLPDVPFLHGGVPLAQRDELVRRFQEDADAPPLLLVSLRAGGTGLNLTRASHVLHYDRWWNPAVEDQATDRAHRIGQTEQVTVHRMVTAGTLEERIAGLLERKRALADAVVGTGEAWITELDDDEVAELVSLATDGLDDDDEEPDDTSPPEPGRPQLVALPGGAS